MSKLSSVRKNIAVLSRTLKTRNDLTTNASISSITTCHSLSSKEVSVEETQSVRFGFVEIREYGRVLVDHPECQDGLGLGLDWKYSRKTTKLSLELFETLQRRKGKREKSDIEQLSTFERKILLKNIGGYSEKQLWEVFFTKLQNDTETKPRATSS